MTGPADPADPADPVGRPSVQVTGLDHIVLRCGDVATTIGWYLDVLGLEPVRVDEWRRGDAPFPSARVDAGTIIDFIPLDGSAGGTDRLDHLCLVVEAIDLDALAAGGRFDVVAGPGTRFGARGDGTSLYVSDPDGTTVELRHY